MDKTIQALLEQRAIVSMHLAVFAQCVEQMATPAELLSQLTRLNDAARAFASLPRPEQKAA